MNHAGNGLLRKEIAMKNLPYGIQGPYRAKRKPLKHYIAIAALVVVVVIALAGLV